MFGTFDRLRRGICAAMGVLAVTVFLSLPADAGTPESADPIKLALNEWTGQHITTYIAGEVLTRMGYSVEYVTAGYYPQITALQDGSITATLEIWSSNIGEGYDKVLATGDIQVIGDMGLKPREAWMYPTYLEEVCPGLPDWTALNACAETLAAPETFPKGRFVDYPAEWGTTNVSRIEALGLNFESIPAGSEGALIAEIKSAYLAKAPLLVMFWEPHWLHSVYDMTIVKLPTYDAACYEDAAWGTNPDKTFDCDWDAGAHIDKVAWSGMQGKWPGAYAMLENYTLTNDAQAQMMHAIDVEGRDVREVVNEWLAANEAAWKGWMK